MTDDVPASRTRPPALDRGGRGVRRLTPTPDAKRRPTTPPSKDDAAALGGLYRRNGYVRRQSAERLARDGYAFYKKGDEVRLTAQSREELESIRDLLIRAGFVPGTPFVKGRQYRQPIYGREAVRRFLEIIGDESTAGPTAQPSRRPGPRSPRRRGEGTRQPSPEPAPGRGR